MRIPSVLLVLFSSVALLLASCADAPEPTSYESAENGTSSHDDDGDMESEVDPDDFVGLTREEAIAEAEEQDLLWRIGREDDQMYPLTMDYRLDRVTFEIDDGVVTSATAG